MHAWFWIVIGVLGLVASGTWHAMRMSEHRGRGRRSLRERRAELWRRRREGAALVEEQKHKEPADEP